ncbi:MAG TPA: nucleotide-binding protein [Acidocella sp.]|nr:nucleotide-binding protein [Acidocella sp.]
MDQKTILGMTLLALQETVRGVASKRDKPSSALQDQINSVLSAVNKLVPGSHFARFGVYPDPIEVLPQIKLALDLIGYDSATAKQVSASSLPTEQSVLKVKHTRTRPQIFIGCSVEGLTDAKLIQLELSHSADTVIWSQGVFGLSMGTLETLVEKAHDFTHAILVLTPDDMINKRENEAPAARDNVLFELGLFMGALGRQKTFVVVERSVTLPTDLAGIATVSFQRGVGVNMVSNIGPVVTKLQIEMGLL